MEGKGRERRGGKRERKRSGREGMECVRSIGSGWYDKWRGRVKENRKEKDNV